MPVVQHTNLNENTILALWKVEETKEQLFSMLGNEFKDNGANFPASIHWLASRVLLQQLFPGSAVELHKDEFNKPSLSIDTVPYHLSISHSHEYAVIIASKEKTVAIDIERIDNRVNRVSHKFIREDEEVPVPEMQTEAYTIIWSAKEALYKYYSKKELDFKKNLRIEPFLDYAYPFFIRGHVEKESYQRAFSIRVEKLNDYVLTYIL
jgi:4'-phosphopantetheinyl transferase